MLDHEKKFVIHLEYVEPGRAPGGVWIRVCTLDRLVAEYGVLEIKQVPGARLEAALAQAYELVAPGDHTWIYFYDGDGGECLSTLIATR